MSHIATVEAFIAAWGARDLDRIVGFFADDAVYHNIPMEKVTGAEAIRANLAPFLEMSATIEWVTYHIAETAAGAVLTERLDRFQIGGRWLEMPVMGIFELSHGKITHWRDYFDLGQFQTQMAAIQAG